MRAAGCGCARCGGGRARGRRRRAVGEEPVDKLDGGEGLAVERLQLVTGRRHGGWRHRAAADGAPASSGTRHAAGEKLLELKKAAKTGRQLHAAAARTRVARGKHRRLRRAATPPAPRAEARVCKVPTRSPSCAEENAARRRRRAVRAVGVRRGCVQHCRGALPAAARSLGCAMAHVMQPSAAAVHQPPLARARAAAAAGHAAALPALPARPCGAERPLSRAFGGSGGSGFSSRSSAFLPLAAASPHAPLPPPAGRAPPRRRAVPAHAAPPEAAEAETSDASVSASAAAAPPAALDLAGPGVFGIPQRWILVAATSAAFVLCNMDKARARGCLRARVRASSRCACSCARLSAAPADAAWRRADGACRAR